MAHTEDAALETETGFGTGLRTHLQRHFDAPEDDHESLAETAEPDAPQPVVDAGEDQLRAELREARDREEALRSALADQVDAYERMLDLERHLALRGEELEERERRVAEELEWVQAETSRLGEQRDRLDSTPEATGDDASAPDAPAAVPGPARAHLRRKLEEDADRIWRVFASALEAAGADGAPDHATRLLAVTTLLAEAYGDGRPTAAEGVADELADKRARRARKP